jgi:hypothetical protein
MASISRLDDYRSSQELMICAGRFVDRAAEAAERSIEHFRAVVEMRRLRESQTTDVDYPCDTEASGGSAA